MGKNGSRKAIGRGVGSIAVIMGMFAITAAIISVRRSVVVYDWRLWFHVIDRSRTACATNTEQEPGDQE